MDLRIEWLTDDSKDIICSIYDTPDSEKSLIKLGAPFLEEDPLYLQQQLKTLPDFIRKIYEAGKKGEELTLSETTFFIDSEKA